MRSARWILAAAAALGPAGTGWAVEGDGLRATDSVWPRWQARLSIFTTVPLPRGPWPTHGTSSGLTFLGDYYFTRPLPRLGETGGFRATSGILLGGRSTPPLSGGLGGRALNVERRNSGSWALLTDPQESGAVPYMGVGYTGLHSKSGWGFSADFGLVGTQTGSRIKLGHSVTGHQNPDEALREMRLSPLLQLGVSYSF